MRTTLRAGLSAWLFLPALLLPAAPIPAQTASAKPVANLPTAEQIVARWVEASGGEKAIRGTTSMHATGRMEIPAMGMTAQLEMFAQAPDKMLMVMELPNVGEIRTGYDGQVGWMENPMMGPMVLEGEQLGDLVRQADFYADLRYADLYPTMETLEKTEFAGEPVYKVRLVDDKGKETIEYFSIESGLKVGFEGEQTSDMGTAFVTTELSDYKDVDGRMVPMTTTSKMLQMEMKMVFDSVDFNSVEDSVFGLPQTIKTLVAGAKKEG